MTDHVGGRRGTHALPLQVAVLALVAYVPTVLTAPGRVAADTKSYLYLDPSKLLSRALSMWDPHIGFGTVTHQNIGYAWPMGPWFWAFEQLGAPDWLAQRLWIGTLLFAAGAGMLYLLRTIGMTRLPAVGAIAVALVYALSPYVLHYAARISVLLLPWAALPWLVGLAHRALRTGSWRHPAAFALVVATVGGVNATALVLAGLGPVLWIAFAVFVHGEATWRHAVRAVGRIGTLTVLCSLWWIAGLAVQGSHGIDILRYTESVETVARASMSSEVLRGMGYWFFYGGDKLGPWIEPGRSYTQHLWLIAVGFALPTAALLAAVLVRWRYRAFGVGLVLVGTAIAVGAFPYGEPSPVGALFRAFAGSSSAALAMRSTPRAIPLVGLGTALLVAAALAALAARRPRAATGAALAVAALAGAGIPPLWTGDIIGENLQRPEEIPGYWHEAAAWLDARGDATRVLAIPGTEFASYRWGNTVDPVLPGLMDRPYAARELIPYGTEAAADLLAAFDRRLQEGVFEPQALAPVARLMGVGDVLLRSDLQYERYRTPRPQVLWQQLTEPVPAGLDAPEGFGAPTPNVAIPRLPLEDEIFLGIPPTAAHPPPVSAFPVRDPLPIVRSRAAAGSIILAGDGEGVVDAAAAGLLGGDGVLLYSAALADRSNVRNRALQDGATLVLTDTNRKRARRWNSVRENTGYTEQTDETPLVEDPSDNRLPLFPAAGSEAFTTVELRGVASAQASDYANPVSYTAGDRPANAFDGDTTTAWRTGGLEGVRGDHLVLRTDGPVTADHVNVVQPLTGPRNRYITRLAVSVDGEHLGTFDLDERSHTEAGQDLPFGAARELSELTLTVEGDNVGRRAIYDAYSSVGLSEVRLAGLRLDEVVRLPTDLLAAPGAGALDHPLVIVLSRLRGNPQELVRSDEELTMVRSFTLPAARTFALEGDARISAAIPGEEVDRLLGGTGPAARASRFLAGDLRSRPSAAIDGDPSTAWTSGFGGQVGDWIDVDVPGRPIDHLDLQLVADGYHSVPTRFVLTTDAGDRHVVEVPAITDGDERGDTTSVTITFPPVRGRDLRLTVDEVRPVRTTDWFSGEHLDMPVAIVELGVPGMAAPTQRGLPSDCRDDLLTIDGVPRPVRLTGTVADALDRRALPIELCGPALSLEAGEHVLRTARGAATGIELDRLVLGSAAGGGAGITRADDPAPRSADPEVRVVRSGSTSFDLEVSAADAPFWLVLGQSNSDGWTATYETVVDGEERSGSLGRPEIVDGYANGWRMPASDGVYSVQLRWTPQQRVWAGVWLSLAGALLCLGIVLGGIRRRRPDGPAATAPEPSARAPWWRTGPAAGLRPTVVTTLVLGLAAGAVVHPLFGVAVGAVTVAALRLPHGRAVGAGAPLLLVATMLFTAGKQWRNGFPPDFGWADFFHPAHYLAWGALWFLVVSLCTDQLRPSPDKSQDHPLDAHRAPPG